jgi:hypothetical protein
MGIPGQLPPLPHFHPRCKVCDYGDLLPKRVFRMSGPAVAIGFILLIPSVVGMLAAACSLLGFIAVTGISHSTPTGPDVEFRRTCINTPESDTTVPITQRVRYCECTLTEYRATNSPIKADFECSQRLQDNTLENVDERTQHLYASLLGVQASPPKGIITIFGLLGSAVAIHVGVASFVGGLLGWLLVMKKRVLQCSACGATVSAS